MQKDNAQAIQQLLKVFDTSKIVSPGDIQAVLAGIVKLLSNFKKQNEALNSDTKSQVEELLAKVVATQNQWQEAAQKLQANHETMLAKVDKKLSDNLKKTQDLVSSTMPKDGKNANPEDVVPLVMAQIKLPQQKAVILDGGEEILEKINGLPADNDDFKIDASRIKNLPIARTKAGALTLHGGFRNTTVYDANKNVVAKAMPFLQFSGSGVAMSTTKDGIVIATISGGGSSAFTNNEVVLGSGTSWTLAGTPLSGTVKLFAQGVRLYPGSDPNFGYSITGTAITTEQSYSAGDLIADYQTS